MFRFGRGCVVFLFQNEDFCMYAESIATFLIANLVSSGALVYSTVKAKGTAGVSVKRVILLVLIIVILCYPVLFASTSYDVTIRSVDGIAFHVLIVLKSLLFAFSVGIGCTLLSWNTSSPACIRLLGGRVLDVHKNRKDESGDGKYNGD